MMIMSEAAVVAMEDTESRLLSENRQIAIDAKQIAIANDDEYQKAGEFARTVKTQQKAVKDYFAPLKDAAHRTHVMICDREKAIMTPLVDAENACKKAMGAYAYKKQEEARRQEAEMRRLAQEEAARKLAEAEAAEAAGRKEEAQSKMQQAIVADEMSATAYVPQNAPKVSGISQKTDWEITAIHEDQVPVEIAGMVIRPVDDKAILRLIRSSKGSVKIPGVEYRETLSMSVSSRRG